jgi:drug/metabolite transporter (DMT)-like permease
MALNLEIQGEVELGPRIVHGDGAMRLLRSCFMTASTTLARPAAARSLVVPALLACYVVWGSTYLAIRFALESFPPFFQMGTRFLCAGALLLAWVSVRGGPWPSAAQWRNAALVGTLMLGGGMGLTATAQQHVGSGLVAAFIAIVPMLVCGWGLLFGQRPRRLEFAGMAVGLAGVLLLVRGASFGAEPLAAICLGLATLAWSLGSVLSSTRLPLAPGAAGFASEMLCGGAALMLVSLALGEQPRWPPSTAAAAAWLYLVVAGSLIAFSAYLYLLSHASPALATSYAFVNPVIALLLGVTLAGEAVSGAEWGACAVVLTGVVLIFLARTEPARR